MQDFFMELVSSQGIWTALSIALIFYIIKKEEKRDLKQEEPDENYQEIINSLSEKLNVVLEIRDMLQRQLDKPGDE